MEKINQNPRRHRPADDPARPTRRPLRTAAALAAAVAAAPAGVLASSSGGTGQRFVVSTSGATALGDVTRSRNNNFITGLGGNITIGGTTYLNDGTGDLNLAETSASAAARDQVRYLFHETGSVEGILELADSYGLGGTVKRPFDYTQANPLWFNGTVFGQTFNAGDTNTGPAVYNNTTNTVTLDTRNGFNGGRNYRNDAASPVGRGPQNTNDPAPAPTGQPLVQIAWSDVKSVQGFAVGTAAQRSINARPTATGADAGYGQGRGNLGATNFQRLRNISAINGGQSNFRNETVAIIPFTVAANPGTGLTTLTRDEGKWLNATGRLSNGANFNTVTRDIGSGTRNQGGNNLGLDPSWAAGERDRIATATFTAQDAEGATVTVNPGSEAPPLRGLNGGTLLLNEDRASPDVRFADKTSGGNRVRPTLLASRMSLGILSSTDVGNRATNLGGAPEIKSEQLRVLKLDFGSGGVLPNAENVTTGAYQMWGQAQAVTVRQDIGNLNDRRIRDDVDDDGAGPGTGVARKFLDNIQNSVAQFPVGATNTTPADGVLFFGFILPQFMGVTKEFDGGPQTTRARPDEARYQTYKTDPSGGATIDWVEPATIPGYVTSGANEVRYNVYFAGNTAASGNSNADKSIRVTQRTALAGDFDGDTVRDLRDGPALALALASPSTYLATPAGSPTPANRQYNGTAMGTVNGVFKASTVPGGLVPADNLIVLGDFNADGSFNRGDARWFLYGASVDTVNANAATGYAGSASAATQRETGVRLGQLKKNAATDTYNTTLDSFVDNTANQTAGTRVIGFTQAQADALKVDKFDVNNDGTVNRADAQYVDRNVGRDYRNLDHTLATSDDLVAAELNDNGTITNVITADGTGTSDFKLIRDRLGSSLLSGDVNFDGAVNGSDLSLLINSFGSTSGQRWGTADFNFDGATNGSDLSLLINNFGGSASLTGNFATEEDWAVLAAFSEGAGVAVPEPGAAAALGLAALGLLPRRRRAGR